MWLSGLGIFPQSKSLPVQFPVRAHAWVAGSVLSWGAYERQLINVSLSHQCFSPSLSPFLPIPLKISKLKFLILKGGGGGEKERERNIDVREKHWLAAFCKHLDWGLNLQPRHVPDQESKWQPFGLQGDAQPTEPHQPGLVSGGLLKHLIVSGKATGTTEIPSRSKRRSSHQEGFQEQ